MKYHAIPLSQAIKARGSRLLVVVGSVLTDHGCRVSFVFKREKFRLPLEAANTLPRGCVWFGKEEEAVIECVGLQRAVNGCSAPL